MAKISIDQLKASIDTAHSILLTVHVSPDGDAIGSMLAMYEALVAQGKAVRMVVDDVIPEKFSFLPLCSKIESLESLENGYTSDMLLILDASTFERIGEVGVRVSAPTFNIDHHISNTEFADGLYLRPDFSSTGETVAYLCKMWNWDITQSMGQALYMAMATDTGFFKFSNTTAHTMEMAGVCLRAGAEPHVISEAIEQVEQARIEVLKDVLEQVRFHHDGQVVSMNLTLPIMERVGDDTDGFVDMIRNIKGVDVAIVLKAKTETVTRASIRSKVRDANQIASHFGGGGHIRAAGCSIESPIHEALEQILAVID